jgi:DNA polymerase III alpha subunit
VETGAVTLVRSMVKGTTLRDRVLWYDGTSSYHPSSLIESMQRHNVKYVTRETQDVTLYNRTVQMSDKLSVKTQCAEFDVDWNLPPQYKNINVVDCVALLHADIIEGISAEEVLHREMRLATELVEFQRLNLFDVLRAIIWVINTLSMRDEVWGVGRGSSVSSYVLYVIGVHDVDSFAYNLPLEDFLHV